MKTHATAAQVARFCDLLTKGRNIADFEGSRNGLQHKGTRPVRKVGAAVDAGAKVFAEAARRGVDFLIVHHGMYWRPVSPEREVRALRKAALKKAGLSLYSSHLPLDAHPAIGNNALIAQDLGLKVVDWFVDYEGLPIAASVRASRVRPCASASSPPIRRPSRGSSSGQRIRRGSRFSAVAAAAPLITSRPKGATR